MKTGQAQREQAIHLWRAGASINEVATALGHSPQWVRKCRRRFEAEGWAGLADRSRAPHQHGRQVSETVRQAVRQARSELEAAAKRSEGLKYIGSRAIRTRLKAAGQTPPSCRTIERILQAADMTHPHETTPEVAYPHLQPTQPHELCQVDHMPHYLQGGTKLYCFNAIDVVSRYPTGQAVADRQAATAARFLWHVWQTLGVPHYTQVDNEACFSGGFTHPYVLSRCVRLALLAGTELVFSPVRHPQSNGYVERFHRDYQQHVWEDTYLADQQAVQQQAERFFMQYRQSTHHSALQEHSPESVHRRCAARPLPSDDDPTAPKLPLYAGRIHFIRCIDPDGTVSVLNVSWRVPNPDFTRGVWVTLDIQPHQANLTIYDQPPDVPDRHQLATYPFPLTEPVLTRTTPPAPPTQTPSKRQTEPAVIRIPEPERLARPIGKLLTTSVRFVRRLVNETIYWRL